MGCHYHYSFVEKIAFLGLWLFGGLYVLINFMSNSILSVYSSAPVLSVGVTLVQIVLLVSLWCVFSKASCSIGKLVRWLVAGILILPYVVQFLVLSSQVI